MTYMHILSNVWRWKINQNCFRFCSFLFFHAFQLNLPLLHINVIDFIMNELIFNENINKPLSFVIWSISHFLHFNFVNGTVIFWNLINNSLGHVHAWLKSKWSCLFVFVENLHCTWRRIVPWLYLFSVNLNSIS